VLLVQEERKRGRLRYCSSTSRLGARRANAAGCGEDDHAPLLAGCHDGELYPLRGVDVVAASKL